MTNPLFNPALATATLKEIQERNQGNADVKTLLWDIRRLHAIAIKADQLVRMTPHLAWASGMVREGLRIDLEGEPVVEELRALERGKDDD